MTQNKRNCLTKIFLILGLLIALNLLNSRTNKEYFFSIPKASSAHTPIDINGNDEMDAFFSTDGTDGLSWETAHIISSYEINGSSNIAIQIRNADRHLIIKKCVLFTDWHIVLPSMTPCLSIKNCENIRIINNNIDNPTGFGIDIRDGSVNITISNNEITDCRTGIAITDSSYNFISKNTIKNINYFGIELRSGSSSHCDYNIISENSITYCEEGGIYLDYNANYNEVCQNCLQNNEVAIDDRSATNNCYNNDNCPGIPGYSILMILGTILGALVLNLIGIRKRLKK